MNGNKRQVSQKIQFIGGFVIPTLILLTLSDESRLGPLLGMVLSLTFPVAIELYAFFTGRKASLISLFAIVGILLIGAISLFGLSEQWLAARRAGIYVFGAVGLIVVARFRPVLVDRAIAQLVDMPLVQSALRKNKAEAEWRRNLSTAVYVLAGILLATAVWSYLLTLIIMTAPTGSSEFNAEYARLRIISLPLVTLPLMVLVVGVLMYVLSRVERLTGIDTERLLKKR